MTSFKITFINELSGLKEIIDIPDDKYILDAACEQNIVEARADLSPTKYADYVDQWISLGATIVGGCCEISPSHIQEIKRRL